MRTFLTRALPAAAIIIGAGFAGFFAYGRFVRPTAWMATASAPMTQSAGEGPAASDGAAGRAVPPSGEAAGSGADTTARRTIPDTLPDIAFPDRTGAMRRLSDWKGRPLLVNFWAPWCVPCREEIPLLERLSRDSAANGLQVIGVGVDSRSAVLDYARRVGIKYPLLIGQQRGLEAIRALGMQPVFPFSVFADAQGRIVTVKIGKLHADEAKLIADRVAELDEGRIDIATARREIANGIARLAVARAHDATNSRS